MTERAFHGVLLDLDGVCHLAGRLIDGAAEAIARIKSQGRACRFLTNTTTRSARALHEQLTEMGLPVEADEVLNPPAAAALYLRRMGDPLCNLVVAEQTIEDFEGLRVWSPSRPETVDVVVIGDIDRAWSYNLMNLLFAQLRAGAALVALHKGRSWQTEAGLRLDIGAFVHGLEYAAGVEATVIGKPNPAFFEMAVRSLELEAADCVMVGDDITGDVGGAQACGIAGVLVRTGKYDDVSAARAGITPNAVLSSIAALPAWLEGGP